MRDPRSPPNPQTHNLPTVRCVAGAGSGRRPPTFLSRTARPQGRNSQLGEDNRVQAAEAYSVGTRISALVYPDLEGAPCRVEGGAVDEL